MRERLIELIQTSVGGCARHWAEVIADYLLENGVVVLPCKVGDVVYLISLDKEIIEYIVMGVSLYPNGLFVEICDGEQTFSIAVKKIHFTREDAERALRKEDEGK